MKINPQAANIAQETYSKNNNIKKDENQSNKADIKNPKQELTLDISSVKEPLNQNDLPEIKEKIASISKQLDVDYSKDSANFSKNNISFYEGSFLTSQTTNLNETAVKLISE